MDTVIVIVVSFAAGIIIGFVGCWIYKVKVIAKLKSTSEEVLK
jgi:uncharacterized protein YneF (UPF0154 family)